MIKKSLKLKTSFMFLVVFSGFFVLPILSPAEEIVEPTEVIYEAGKHTCDGVVEADMVKILPGAELTGIRKNNYSQEVKKCIFKTTLFENQGKLVYPLDLEIEGNFKNNGEITTGKYYNTIKYPKIEIQGNIENNSELAVGLNFKIKNNSSLENPIEITGTAKAGLELNDENNQYFFSDSLNLTNLRSTEKEVEIYLPDHKNIFIENLDILTKINFKNINQIEIGKSWQPQEIIAEKSILTFTQNNSSIPTTTAQKIIFQTGYFRPHWDITLTATNQIIITPEAEMISKNRYGDKKQVIFVGDVENQGKLKISEIQGNLNNSGEIEKRQSLIIKGNLTNSGTISEDIYYHDIIELYGNLNNSGTIAKDIYLHNNLDHSQKELTFLTNTNPKIYLQEDIYLSKKTREIPYYLKSNNFKLILEDGSYLKLANIDNLFTEGNNLILETARLKNTNNPTNQLILSGDHVELEGENIFKNVLIDSPQVFARNNFSLQTESLEISEQSDLKLYTQANISGKILNKGYLHSHYSSQYLIIEDDFTNLGEISLSYIYFKNLGDEYQYFLKEKVEDGEEEPEEVLLQKNRGHYSIGSQIRSKKPYDLIIKDTEGNIFKTFKLNQEMILPEITVPPVEPENLEFTFSNEPNSVLENTDFILNLTANRKLRITDSHYDSDTEELNFYLSTNFQNGRNIFPEVISIKKEDFENVQAIPITLKITEPISPVKIYLKNEDGNVLGESKLFNVLETQKVFFRIPEEYDLDGKLTISKINNGDLENLEEVKTVYIPHNSKSVSENLACNQSYVFDYQGYDSFDTGTRKQKKFQHITAIRCNSNYVIFFQAEKPLSNDECQQEDRIPVLLVPGILGSTTKGPFGGGFGNDTYPDLPEESPAWDSGELVLHDALEFFGQQKVGWKKLIRSLKTDQGYIRNCNIIDVPYDWRLEIPQIRDLYLKPWIDEAKRRTGKDKVDIIAHSMGGLVTRSYIQSDKYNNDIRNFVMVGTPNQGSADAYYLYNGYPVLADYIAGNQGEDISILDTNISNYMNTQTVINLHEVMTDGEPICLRTPYYNLNMYANNSISGLVYYLLTDERPKKQIKYVCNHEKVADFVRKNVPSLKQLLPTFPFLRNEKNELNSLQKVKNNFLVSLNQGSTFKGETYSLATEIKDKVDNFYILGGSKNNSTIQEIKIKDNPTQKQIILFADGLPIEYNPLRGLGDGTVLINSLHPEFFKDTTPIFQDSSHRSLIKNFSEVIVNLIK